MRAAPPSWRYAALRVVRIDRQAALLKRSGRGPGLVSGFLCLGSRGSEEFQTVNLSEGRDISRDRVRVNDQIRISPIRLIQDDGEQIGIVSIDEARERAEVRGMDLVEVAPEARPPVVKMMDYGKYKYEADRQRRDARKKQHTIKVKEVKFRPGIEDHDYNFKVGHARRFLEEGNKVKLTMMFRGRQITHPEIGKEVLARVMEDLQELGQPESFPNMEGRIMSMVLAPIKE